MDVKVEEEEQPSTSRTGARRRYARKRDRRRAAPAPAPPPEPVEEDQLDDWAAPALVALGRPWWTQYGGLLQQPPEHDVITIDDEEIVLNDEDPLPPAPDPVDEELRRIANDLFGEPPQPRDLDAYAAPDPIPQQPPAARLEEPPVLQQLAQPVARDQPLRPPADPPVVYYLPARPDEPRQQQELDVPAAQEPPREAPVVPPHQQVPADVPVDQQPQPDVPAAQEDEEDDEDDGQHLQYLRYILAPIGPPPLPRRLRQALQAQGAYPPPVIAPVDQPAPELFMAPPALAGAQRQPDVPAPQPPAVPQHQQQAPVQQVYQQQADQYRQFWDVPPNHQQLPAPQQQQQQLDVEHVFQPYQDRYANLHQQLHALGLPGYQPAPYRQAPVAQQQQQQQQQQQHVQPVAQRQHGEGAFQPPGQQPQQQQQVFFQLGLNLQGGQQQAPQQVPAAQPALHQPYLGAQQGQQQQGAFRQPGDQPEPNRHPQGAVQELWDRLQAQQHAAVQQGPNRQPGDQPGANRQDGQQQAPQQVPAAQPALYQPYLGAQQGQQQQGPFLQPGDQPGPNRQPQGAVQELWERLQLQQQRDAVQQGPNRQPGDQPGANRQDGQQQVRHQGPADQPGLYQPNLGAQQGQQQQGPFPQPGDQPEPNRQPQGAQEELREQERRQRQRQLVQLYQQRRLQAQQQAAVQQGPNRQPGDQPGPNRQDGQQQARQQGPADQPGLYQPNLGAQQGQQQPPGQLRAYRQGPADMRLDQHRQPGGAVMNHQMPLHHEYGRQQAMPGYQPQLLPQQHIGGIPQPQPPLQPHQHFGGIPQPQPPIRRQPQPQPYYGGIPQPPLPRQPNRLHGERQPPPFNFMNDQFLLPPHVMRPATPPQPQPQHNMTPAELRDAIKVVTEMFPNVCRQWITDNMYRGKEPLIDFILENMDSERVVKVKRKRKIVKEPAPMRGPAPKKKKALFDINKGFCLDDLKATSEGRSRYSYMVEKLVEYCEHDTHKPSLPFVFEANMLKRRYIKILPVFIDWLLCINSEDVTGPKCSPVAVIIILELISLYDIKLLYERKVLNTRYIPQHCQTPHLVPFFEDWPPTLAQWTNDLPAGPYHDALDTVHQMMIQFLRGRPIFTCGVCFEDVCEFDEVSSCQTIDTKESEIHMFCNDCVGHHAEASAEEGRVLTNGAGIPCMEPGCPRHFTIASISAFLKTPALKVLEKKIQQAVLISSGVEVERCKYCNFAAEIGTSKEEDKVFNCTECRATFCRLCFKDWDVHIGLRCDEIESEQEKNRKRLEEELSNAVIHNCPRCNLYFEKESGCNKMTCSCGMNQCYVCRQSNIGYDHFCQCAREPNQNRCPLNCGRNCLLFQDVKRDMRAKRERIVNNARIVLGEEIADKLA